MLGWRVCKSTELLNMFRNLIVIKKSIVALLWATILFSCKGNLDEVNKRNQISNDPQAKAYNVNLFYTDSGKVKVNLRSPLVLDYTHFEFPYREFPNTVDVDFFDADSSKSSIFAKYAIIYEQTGLVDMQDSVSITTAEGLVLQGEQLYWDQNKGWIFTDQNYTITMPNGTTNNGQGFDANQKFTIFISRSNRGRQIIDQENEL